MDLKRPSNLRVTRTGRPERPPAHLAGKTLHDHPPQAWAEALLRKYGPCRSRRTPEPCSSVATSRRDEGTRWKPPRRWRRRVAYNIALAEGLYYGALPEWCSGGGGVLRDDAPADFLPNSPTLMNAGRELQQLSACFVLPVDDSMESIFEAVKNTALIHKSGGGPASPSPACARTPTSSLDEGSLLRPISFMTVFDAATETSSRADARAPTWNPAGRPPGHPRLHHLQEPDEPAQQLQHLRRAHEEFMKAVREREEYSLVNPHSREVTGRLPAARYSSGSSTPPGKTGAG